jgi:hypothetical protein
VSRCNLFLVEISIWEYSIRVLIKGFFLFVHGKSKMLSDLQSFTFPVTTAPRLPGDDQDDFSTPPMTPTVSVNLPAKPAKPMPGPLLAEKQVPELYKKHLDDFMTPPASPTMSVNMLARPTKPARLTTTMTPSNLFYL